MWEDNQCLPIPDRDLESVGITPSGDLSTDDQNIYNNCRQVITETIRKEADLHLPEDFEVVPTSIARQIESSYNC